MSNKNQLIRDLIGAENIEKVKRLLKFDVDTAAEAPLEAPVDVVFTDVKAKDGSNLKVEGSLDAGSKVSIVTAEGDQPAPDGDIELEDGKVLSIVGGLITEVKEPKAEEPKADEAMAEVTEQIAQLKKQFAAQKTEIEQAKKFNKELFALVEKILDAPSGEAIEKPKQSFTKGIDLKKDIQEFRNSLKK